MPDRFGEADHGLIACKRAASDLPHSRLPGEEACHHVPGILPKALSPDTSVADQNTHVRCAVQRRYVSRHRTDRHVIAGSSNADEQVWSSLERGKVKPRAFPIMPPKSLVAEAGHDRVVEPAEIAVRDILLAKPGQRYFPAHEREWIDVQAAARR